MTTREDFNRKELNEMQQKASMTAMRENNALKLSYKTVVEGEIVVKEADGRTKRLGTPKYGNVKVKRQTFKLK